MKTKGITFARAKKALCILALLASLPVSAQVSFASQNDISLTRPEKRFVVNLLNYYVAAETLAGPEHTTPMPFFPFYRVKYNKAKDEIIYKDRQAINNNSSLEKDNTINSANVEIKFKPTFFTYPESCGQDLGIVEYSPVQLMLYAKALKQYAIKNDFDTSYAFFSNMAMRFDKKRFFVVNLSTMEIEQSGLVAQGRGQGRSRFDKQYSNKSGSKCTSLGRYKIMSHYKGGYGESYRMAGLDSSNSNAYNRNVVLHSMGCIPDTENNIPVCISEGCPAVSVNFLSSLSRIIDSRKKPILLWIFDSNLEEAVIEYKPLPNMMTESGYMAENKYHTCSLHSHNHPDIQ